MEQLRVDVDRLEAPWIPNFIVSHPSHFGSFWPFVAPWGKVELPETDQAETALIERVKKGERDRFLDLIRPCERSVYLAALAIVGNEADAEDVAQEAVLKAFRNLHQFRFQSRFSTWLIRITINEARMRLRQTGKARLESLDQAVEDDEGDYAPRDLADWREIPSEALERKQLRQALADALASLPEKYRVVFVLRDVEHLSIAQAAEALGLTEAAVKTRLLRARLQLRDLLAAAWGAPSAARSRG
jgi:RNA polymerase sigma-70 factor, ECF subfamily